MQLAARSASIDESFHSSDDEDDEETPEQKGKGLSLFCLKKIVRTQKEILNKCICLHIF